MKIDKDFGLLYGILMGDGCIGKYKYKEFRNKYNYNISIICNLLDDIPFFNEIVGPLILRLTGRKIKYRYRKDYNCITYNFCNKELFYKLENTGFPVGKKGPNMIIPNIFFKNNLIKQVVQGFFSTDGSLVLTKNPNKYYPRLESQAIHKFLMLQIHEYLSKTGMKGHFYKCKSKPDPRFKMVQQKYKFQFNGNENLLIFKDKVGFVNPKHQERFKKFMNYSENYLSKDRDEHNEEFLKLIMPLRGFEPRMSSS